MFYKYFKIFISLGIHPTTISESFQRAAAESEKILKAMATPVDLANDDELVKLATTSLNSKVSFTHVNNTHLTRLLF